MRFRTRFLGYEIEQSLARIGLIDRAIGALSEDRLTPLELARMWRARRDETPYLANGMRRLVADERDHLTVLHCRNALTRRVGGPRFRKALAMAETRLEERRT
jgi:hypothetical protein